MRESKNLEFGTVKSLEFGMESTEVTDGSHHLGHLDSVCTVRTNIVTNGQRSKEGVRSHQRN